MKHLLSSSLLAIASASDSKCYGLALSSGSNVGPYQAGALQAMLESGGWDAISGVTEGALNAYILSLYGKDESLAASDHLNKFWNNIASNKVYENYDLGPVEGMMIQDSLYKGEPLMEFIEQEFADEALYP